MNITASVLSLAGSPFPGKPRFSPLERAKAAHAVGIPAIGVTLDELDDLPRKPDRILRYAAIPEAEWIDLRGIPSRVDITRLKTLHDEFGVTRVNVGACDPSTPAKVAARNLRILADDLWFMDMIAVEPVAFGSPDLYTPEQVEDVIAEAGYWANCGVLLDCWQAAQHGTLPGRYADELPIGEIQICGRTSVQPAYPSDTIHEKMFAASQDRLYLREDPSFDVRAWLTLVNPHDDIPVSYEVPRREHQHMTLTQIAEGIAADLAAL